MSTAESRNLASDLFRLLAQDAISLQISFDQAHLNDLEVFRCMIGNAQGSKDLEAILSSMIPPRLRVEEYKIETGVVVRRSRQKGLGIRLIPLNLGFSLRYGKTETEENRVVLKVIQSPLTSLPSKDQI